MLLSALSRLQNFLLRRLIDLCEPPALEEPLLWPTRTSTPSRPSSTVSSPAGCGELPSRADPDASQRLLSVSSTSKFLLAVPRPPGDPSRWLQRFLGPGGLTPTPLVELVRGLTAKGFTDTMEPRVDTAMTFEFSSPARAIELLQARRPEFSLTEAGEQSTSFDWTRKYPAGHWSPLAAFGGRQIVGDITVEPRSLVVRAHALSMAARLAETLRLLLGPELRLRSVHWHDISGNVEKRAEL